ncbi:SWC3 [Candida theae]|uniref:SWC3 n=1 Tax=Candida theae TaxID=1198502 RepID=A0AAD5BGQ6_9ASCO|nr:SWC3 [Candida theae]KAI5960528.1 SWC3 [Candida theae]
MPARIRRRITSSRRDEIEKEQEEQSQQIIRPFENVHGLPVSYTASSQTSFLNQPLTIKDTAVLYLSLIKSRSSYLKLCPMFQLYWVKQSSYIKKLMEQDKPIPEHLKRDDIYANRPCVLNNDISARDIMVKLLECGLSIGVHFFEIRVFIAKDERSDTKEEKERMKREREEKRAQREQEKLERKIKREQEQKEREERKIQKEIEKREELLKRKEEQGQAAPLKSNTSNEEKREKREKREGSKSSIKASKASLKGKKDVNLVKVEEDTKSKTISMTPSPPIARTHGDLQSPDNQRMISNLNYIGSKNKALNDLMNEVASGRATTSQISLFQKYIREAKCLGHPPHSEETINEVVAKIDNEVVEERRLEENRSNVNTSHDQKEDSKQQASQENDSSTTGNGIENATSSHDRQGPSLDGHPSNNEVEAVGANSSVEAPSQMSSGQSSVKQENIDSRTLQQDLRTSPSAIGQQDKKKKILKKDIPKDQKLTAFQEKYIVNATVLFEFLENPNVRFQFPKFAICEVMEPSTSINSDNGDNGDNKDILVSFLWIHNQKAMDKYETELSQYQSKMKEKQEADRKREEEEKEKNKAVTEEEDKMAGEVNGEVFFATNDDDDDDANIKEESPSAIEGSTMADAAENDQGDATIQEEKFEEESTVPVKRRAPPPRRGKKKRRGPPPKKAAPKSFIPPSEPVYSYSSVSFTIHGVPNKFVPIFVNSLDPVDKVRKKMEHILETGNRVNPYQLWYQVDGKLDAALAETARVSLNQEEKKMTGIPTIQEKVEPKKYPKKKRAKEADQSVEKHTNPSAVKSEPARENAVVEVEVGSTSEPQEPQKSESPAVKIDESQGSVTRQNDDNGVAA